MIDGKSRAEILAMPSSTRCNWYKTLGLVDRGWAMEFVNTAGRAKQSGENHALYGKPRSDETKAKQRAAWTSEKRAALGATRSGENHYLYGKTRSDEFKAKMSGENHPQYGKPRSDKTKAKLRAFAVERWKDPEYRARLSGEKNGNWQGGSSFEPYHYDFNEERKEEVRNRDERRCLLCGKSEILNGQRLTAHHINGDKMDTRSSNLAALCSSCNSRADTTEKEFLIVANLNLPRSEI